MQVVEEKTLKQVKKYAEFFADLAIQEYDLMRSFKPSVIGIAAIMCSRRVSKIVPEWNPCLEELTDYHYVGEVKECTDKLFKTY